MTTKTKIQTLVRYGDGSHHEIFRPVPVSRIKALLEEHDDKKAAIKEIASFMGGDRYEEVLPCFLDAVQRVVVKDLFNEERALRALDAQSWRKVLGATDIYDIMPQKRRDLWNALTPRAL